MDKRKIRMEMKEIRSMYSKENLENYSQSILKHLYELSEYQNAKQILTYLSFGSELDTWQLIREQLDPEHHPHREIYLPKVEEKNMNFYRIHDLEHLVTSHYGALEPATEKLSPYDVTQYFHRSNRPLMIMPGLAFDRSGNRIGYGGGYYDKYLGLHGENHFNKVAFSLDSQLLDKIETNPLDIKVDYIITPTEVIYCR